MKEWTAVSIVVGSVLFVLYVLFVEGCSALPPFNSKVDDCETRPSGWCKHYNTADQSWDQENLKRNDTGCPSAVYDAPNGNLRLCGPTK